MHALRCSRLLRLSPSSVTRVNRVIPSPYQGGVSTATRHYTSRPPPLSPHESYSTTPDRGKTAFSATTPPSKGGNAGGSWETWVKGKPPGDHRPPISFPWIFAENKAAHTPFPYRTTYLPHRWLYWIPISVYHALSRSLVLTYLVQATGKEYIGEQFLYGVSLAIGRLFRAISEQNETDLKTYLSEQLYKRVLQELEGVKASGHTLHVYVPRVHDCVISDAWMWAGKNATFEEIVSSDMDASSTAQNATSQSNAEKPIPKIIELATIFIGLDRRPTKETAQDLVKNALKDSAKFRIDVEVDLELHWRVTHTLANPNIASNIITGADIHETTTTTTNQHSHHDTAANTTATVNATASDNISGNDSGDHTEKYATEGLVAEGGCRRTLSISFDTPWFRPAAQIMDLWGKDNQPSHWQWKISDVDFLLRDEALEKHRLPHN
ncbi:hypothetical protein BDF22DRAFT_666657 [Syncephalis plumigaleata]|nr:hypothetical protein BDF22DRAFT_666657 [Syncephalis plumigaleata]